jgi:hypothetical protein
MAENSLSSNSSNGLISVNENAAKRHYGTPEAETAQLEPATRQKVY